MIRIDFKLSDIDNVYTYSDAIYLEDDHSFTEDEIEAMKQARFTKWLAVITTPVEPVQQEVLPIDG